MKFKDFVEGDIFYRKSDIDRPIMKVTAHYNVNAVSLIQGHYLSFGDDDEFDRATEYELIELIKTKLPKPLIFSSINPGEIFSMHSTVSGVDNTYTCIKTGKMSHRHQEGNAVVIDTLNLCNYYRKGGSVKVQDYEVVKRLTASYEEESKGQ